MKSLLENTRQPSSSQLRLNAFRSHVMNFSPRTICRVFICSRSVVIPQLARRQAAAQRRREDKAFEQRMAEVDELESKGLRRVFDAIAGFFKMPN